ncbi:hypothetical protein J6590_016657 [Homalodisca vitripennis]|nr:hypothetical protein J6590_016657 [Homalodisca vitripennis]
MPSSQHVLTCSMRSDADKLIDEWHPSMKQNIWELSGLLEGDIMEPHSEMSERNAAIDETLRWPDGEVPYHISSDFDENEKSIIRGAMDEYHDKSCIRFRPFKRGDPDYITIRGDAPGCWSYVGRRSGGQVVNLQGRCVQHGVALHELLHALGFYHQQSASDRDDFVKIHWQNIRPRTRSNFKKYSSFRVTDYGVPYDYGSIMHYSSHAFSRNGKPTITPLQTGASIGQRFGLSDADTKKLNVMYGCDGRHQTSPSHSHLSLDTTWTPSFDTFWDRPFYYY